MHKSSDSIPHRRLLRREWKLSNYSGNPTTLRRRSRVSIGAVISLLALFTIACGSDSAPEKPVPPVDSSITSVALEDVIFDLFDGGYVPFPEVSPSLVEELRDAIVPIYKPVYGESEEGNWLPDRELVIGYVGEEQAYAYPVRMLNFHELVADTIDVIPLLVTY